MNIPNVVLNQLGLTVFCGTHMCSTGFFFFTYNKSRWRSTCYSVTDYNLLTANVALTFF